MERIAKHIGNSISLAGVVLTPALPYLLENTRANGGNCSALQRRFHFARGRHPRSVVGATCLKICGAGSMLLNSRGGFSFEPQLNQKDPVSMTQRSFCFLNLNGTVFSESPVPVCLVMATISEAISPLTTGVPRAERLMVPDFLSLTDD